MLIRAYMLVDGLVRDVTIERPLTPELVALLKAEGLSGLVPTA